MSHRQAVHAPPETPRCPFMPTYAAPPVRFVRGEGSWLWDADGKRYLDFLSGIAVTSLGHAHPVVAEAIAAQARTLLAVSNFFATDPATDVALVLDRLLGGDGQVFFCNSGAEANEAAIKLARRWGARHGGGPGVPHRFTVVSALGSFHGRTLATLHATGQTAKHEAFQPLPDGFRHVPWCDLDALDRAVDPETVAAVLLEPVEAEGGVHPATTEFFQAVRRLCDERDVLLMVDEVQTGLGRTGRWFGFEHYGIRPDVVTLAKALGNGVPVGACWARAEVAASFRPGDHGSTFGGQPLAAAAARAVLQVMEAEDVPARAEAAGARLRAALLEVPRVTSVRGPGLLVAAELDGGGAKDVVARCLEAGLVCNAVTETAVRFLPSLLVSDDEIDHAVGILAEVAGR